MEEGGPLVLSSMSIPGDIHQSILSATDGATARSKHLANSRKSLSKRTEEAIKRQKQAADAKAKLQQKAKHKTYVADQLHKLRVEEETRQEVLVLPTAPERDLSVSSRGTTTLSAEAVDEALARARQRELMELKSMMASALENARQAGQEVEATKQRLRDEDAAAKKREFQKAQKSWKKREAEKKKEQRLALRVPHVPSR